MIKNLPDFIFADILEDFDVGQAEALEDELLWDCYCDIPPIKEHLKDKKDILLGNKGSGKTAIFRLLSEQKLNYYNKNNYKQIMVPIDETIEYLSISSKLNETMRTTIESEDTKYRFLWEVYILYRIAVKLKENQEISNTKLSKRLNTLIEFFNITSSKPTLLEFLSATKKTAGFKLDYTNPSLPLPDFYISTEPSENIPDKEDVDPRTINIDEIKKLISECLQKNKSAIFVLVDNVDDFIAREGYQVQKQILQGLISCSSSYSKYPLIKIKLFLREELFHKLNFSELGGFDKVSPRTINLRWSNTDIRRFLAERILNNLVRTLGIKKNLQFEMDEKDLFVLKRKSYRNKTYFEKLLHHLGFVNIFHKKRNKDSRDAWDITEMDQVWRDSITCLLPRTINHYTINGVIEENEDIFEYFEDHFCLANGSTTPRVMLLFLDKLISLSTSYYTDKISERLDLDQNGEYALFKRDHIMKSYGNLQDTMVEMFISCITKENWRRGLVTLFAKRGKKTSFSYRVIQKTTGLSDDSELREFVAFLEHLGVLYCSDKQVSLVQRKYELPILLQKNWSTG